jgi:hypothetical protein
MPTQAHGQEVAGLAVGDQVVLPLLKTMAGFVK